MKRHKQSGAERRAISLRSSLTYNNTPLSQLKLDNSTKCLDGNPTEPLITYDCHTSDSSDFNHQQFTFNKDKTISSEMYGNDACLTLSNALEPYDDMPNPATSKDIFVDRVEEMLAAVKSSGMNGIAINNVNACGNNAKLLSSDVLQNLANNVKDSFVKYDLKMYFTICFSAPVSLAYVTQDPTDDVAAAWWVDKANEIVSLLGKDMLGGFLVKADSEGNLGPDNFNKTEADGANLLADALVDHNAVVMWRAFVYGQEDEDRSR